MGALEWIVTTAVLSAVVGGAVAYWVLDFELRLVEERLKEVEKDVYRDRLEDKIDELARERS
jgi:hypothetical protein